MTLLLMAIAIPILVGTLFGIMYNEERKMKSKALIPPLPVKKVLSSEDEGFWMLEGSERYEIISKEQNQSWDQEFTELSDETHLLEYGLTIKQEERICEIGQEIVAIRDNKVRPKTCKAEEWVAHQPFGSVIMAGRITADKITTGYTDIQHHIHPMGKLGPKTTEAIRIMNSPSVGSMPDMRTIASAMLERRRSMTAWDVYEIGETLGRPVVEKPKDRPMYSLKACQSCMCSDCRLQILKYYEEEMTPLLEKSNYLSARYSVKGIDKKIGRKDNSKVT